MILIVKTCTRKHILNFYSITSLKNAVFSSLLKKIKHYYKHVCVVILGKIEKFAPSLFF